MTPFMLTTFNNVIVPTALLFIERQLAKYGAETDAHKVGSDFCKRIADLIPHESFGKYGAFATGVFASLCTIALETKDKQPPTNDPDHAKKLAEVVVAEAKTKLLDEMTARAFELQQRSIVARAPF